jgi:nickel-dependent lactate racemase
MEAFTMVMKKFSFGFGNGTVEMELPAERIIHEIEGRPATSLTDVPTAVQTALRNPIGTPPLAEVVKPGETVAIIVSDITRAWIKASQFLPTLLDELNAVGVADKDIFIVISLGAHRPHTEEEDIQVCGASVCHRVRIYQHNARDKENLTYVGTTSRGVAAWINKRVMDADRIILTGGIVYHLMAGFGAGRKAVMPGISGYETIQGNHRFCLHPQVGKGINPNCMSGRTNGNEMHEDQMEITALVDPDFLLNVVFTPEGNFAGIFAGHWQFAWEAGCHKVEEIFGIPITAQADLVVASAGGYPKDINLYQGTKTLDNAYMATKPGGVAICFLECRDILEPAEFSNWFKYPDALAFENALRGAFTVPGFVAFKCLSIAKDISMIIVTKPENAEFVRKTGMIPAASAAEALQIARQKIGRDDFTITVMAHAANTVPLLK